MNRKLNSPAWLAGIAWIALTFAAPATAQDRLAKALAAVDADPDLGRAIWGIRVEDEHETVLVAQNSTVLLMPASARKLFSVAVIGECEGWNATIPTEVRMTGRVRRNTLRGNLVIVGHGDPSLGGRWEYETDRFARLRPVVDALKARGIRRIDGAIVVDVSEFDADTIPSGWKWDNLTTAYAAPVDAIAFNENSAAVRVRAQRCDAATVETDPPFATVVAQFACDGAPLVIKSDASNRIGLGGDATALDASEDMLIAIADPAAWAGEAIRAMLASSGISVSRVDVVGRRSRGGVEGELLATVESPPIGSLSGTMVKESANLYAEMLFKRISRSGGPASYERSLGIEREYLTDRVGIDPGDFRFVDGSGLSSEDLVTPAAMVRLMRYLRRSGHGEIFERILAEPGGEGTLRRRLLDLNGRVFAKTGTINGVNALAGWVYRTDGKVRYFAILVNHHTVESHRVNRAIDEIVRALAE